LTSVDLTEADRVRLGGVDAILQKGADLREQFVGAVQGAIASHPSAGTS
jgi:hypothetical protein